MRRLMITAMILCFASCAVGLLTSCAATGAGSRLGFFLTSTGSGRGGDLGGLAGADNHCQMLAASVGAGGRTWRAYLSTQAANGRPGINARDRIGAGPWANAQGVVIASSVADLHAANVIKKSTALTESGALISGRGDTPNLHDVLTGSQPDGSFIAGSADSTCSNWTARAGGSAMVGHHDRAGVDETTPSKSWNSSHQTRGCSTAELTTTGGAGLYYCFAAD